MKSKQKSTLMATAADENIDLNILFTAQDADVIKTYVRNDMGVGVIASMAFDPKLDDDLIAYSTKDILTRSTTWLCVKKGTFFPVYMKDFVQLFAPHVSHDVINQYLKEDGLSDDTGSEESQVPMHQTWEI